MGSIPITRSTPHRGATLFDASRHTPLGDSSWDANLARQALDELAAGAVAALAQRSPWQLEDGVGLSLYAGAAGVQWALRQLAARQLIELPAKLPGPDLRACDPPCADYRKLFERFAVPVSNSFLLGPVGVLMTLWQESADPGLLDRLDTLIGDNLQHPWMENLWGAPSTMLAALHLLEASGEERFAAHYRAGVQYLQEHLAYSTEYDCELWEIPLYGGSYRLLGAGHGFVGNAFAILRGLPLLDTASQRQWIDCIARTMTLTAVQRGGLANWPQSLGGDRPGRSEWLVQHCHGAPGIVIDLAALFGQVDNAFDALLLAAGELAWRAGPLAKYPGLCHGTAGNGYAFLKLYRASGDERWLDRARAFAVAGLQQRRALLAAGAGIDTTLWEGDMGLALYLADCLQAHSAFPTMDYF